jgi:hypothetical protein
MLWFYPSQPPAISRLGAFSCQPNKSQ